MKTLAAIKQSKYLLKKLSKDRIWKEFKLILSSDGVCLALRFMKETGVLNILFSSISLKNIGNLVELEKKIISEFLGKHYFNTFELKDPILRLSILLDPKEKYSERVIQAIALLAIDIGSRIHLGKNPTVEARTVFLGISSSQLPPRAGPAA